MKLAVSMNSFAWWSHDRELDHVNLVSNRWYKEGIRVWRPEWCIHGSFCCKQNGTEYRDPATRSLKNASCSSKRWKTTLDTWSGKNCCWSRVCTYVVMRKSRISFLLARKFKFNGQDIVILRLKFLKKSFIDKMNRKKI